MADASRLAVCPGSFDPLTKGHLDMITRGARLFDRLIVGVLINPAKQPWFSLEQRVEMVRQVVSTTPHLEHVEVEAFQGLLADYIRQRGATAIIRGLRGTSDSAAETQMALMNRHLAPGCETVFVVPAPEVSFISSRLVKEVATLGGRVDGLVPPHVAAVLAERQLGARTVRA